MNKTGWYFVWYKKHAVQFQAVLFVPDEQQKQDGLLLRMLP